MAERRKRIMKRLLMEELERRTMLNGTEIAMASTGLTNNSYEDFYKAQVGTEIGGAAGVGMLDQQFTPGRPGAFVGLPGTVPSGPTTNGFDFNAATGVGQMLLTTGANTPGIGSFATPTAGPSRAGGTGNASMGGDAVQPAVVDQALEELSFELPSLATTKPDGTELKRAKREEAAEEAQASSSRKHDRQLDALEEMLALVEVH